MISEPRLAERTSTNGASPEIHSKNFEAHAREFRIASIDSNLRKAVWSDDEYFAKPISDEELMDARKFVRKRFAETPGELSFYLANPPETIDLREDHVGAFNEALVQAFAASGLPQESAGDIFEYVNTPNEWRGALTEALRLARIHRTDAGTELSARIETVCQFVLLSMRYAGPSFVWVLACGTRVLRESIADCVD